MICGIYKIQNIENDKVYIGKSSNIMRRWIEHQHKLQFTVRKAHSFRCGMDSTTLLI